MELQDYWRVLRTHWLGIIVIALAGLLVAGAWATLTPKVYTADASGWVTGGGGSDTGSALVGDSLAKSRISSYLEFGASRAVAERVIDDLGLTVSPEALVSRVEVVNPSDSTVIRVSADGSTPESARDLAESWLRAMIAQIAAVEDETSGGQGVSVVSLVPIDSARLPGSPSFPNLRNSLAIGGLAGLVLGVAYAFVRHAVDRRVRTAEIVERELGVAVVGALPLDKAGAAVPVATRLRELEDGSGTTADSRAIAESVRGLRTNLQFMDVDNPPRVIVVTSPLPGDGKSTVSAYLAVILAATEQPVVLIDGDLRRPSIVDKFGLVEGVGLTDVLSGSADVDDVLQGWGRTERLSVLPAGSIPPNPSELLASERMRHLLAELAERAIVIIDAPPLLPVTDAAILTNRSDGAFVVASAGSTTVDVLGRALGNLERANARTLGVVLNRTSRRGPEGTKYGYSYYGDYHAAPAKAAQAAASDEAANAS